MFTLCCTISGGNENNKMSSGVCTAYVRRMYGASPNLAV